MEVIIYTGVQGVIIQFLLEPFLITHLRVSLDLLKMNKEMQFMGLCLEEAINLNRQISSTEAIRLPKSVRKRRSHRNSQDRKRSSFFSSN
jgi:hypothetical protein